MQRIYLHLLHILILPYIRTLSLDTYTRSSNIPLLKELVLVLLLLEFGLALTRVLFTSTYCGR